MNYEQLRQVAERRGVIRWLQSRKIEFLSIVDGEVMAFRMYPRGSHVINKWPSYLCVEMAPIARVLLVDLDWTIQTPLPAMGVRRAQ